MAGIFPSRPAAGSAGGGTAAWPATPRARPSRSPANLPRLCPASTPRSHLADRGAVHADLRFRRGRLVRGSPCRCPGRCPRSRLRSRRRTPDAPVRGCAAASSTTIRRRRSRNGTHRRPGGGEPYVCLWTVGRQTEFTDTPCRVSLTRPVTALTRSRRTLRRRGQCRVGPHFGPACAGRPVGFGSDCFIQNRKAYCARIGQSGDHLGKCLPGCLDDSGAGAQDFQHCHLGWRERTE